MEVGDITLGTTMTTIPALSNGLAGMSNVILRNGSRARVINPFGVAIGAGKRVELQWSPKEVWEIIRSEI